MLLSENVFFKLVKNITFVNFFEVLSVRLGGIKFIKNPSILLEKNYELNFSTLELLQ